MITHHHVNQISNGIDKRPNPLAVSLRVDGTSAREEEWGLTNKAVIVYDLGVKTCTVPLV